MAAYALLGTLVAEKIGGMGGSFSLVIHVCVKFAITFVATKRKNKKKKTGTSTLGIE